MRHLGVVGALAAILAWTTPAAGKGNVEEIKEDIETQAHSQGLRTGDEVGMGFAGVHVKAGVASMTGGLSDLTGVGPEWGVDLSFTPLEITGIELAYAGSRIPIVDARLSDDAAVFRNGVDLLAKIYPPMKFPLRPFAGTGLGLSYVNPNDQAEGPYHTDFILDVPFAVGLEFTKGPVMAGLRGQWTYFSGESFADPGGDLKNPNGGQLSGLFTIGGQFL